MRVEHDFGPGPAGGGTERKGDHPSGRTPSSTPTVSDLEHVVTFLERLSLELVVGITSVPQDRRELTPSDSMTITPMRARRRHPWPSGPLEPPQFVDHPVVHATTSADVAERRK